jgi:hypothetical protein
MKPHQQGEQKALQQLGLQPQLPPPPPPKASPWPWLAGSAATLGLGALLLRKPIQKTLAQRALRRAADRTVAAWNPKAMVTAESGQRFTTLMEKNPHLAEALLRRTRQYTKQHKGRSPWMDAQ